MRAFLWVFVAAGLGLAVRGLRPPAPLGLDAPAEAFSAARAWPTIQTLAAAPRARPSPHHAEARAFLADQLRALGLEIQEQEAVVFKLPVTNLLARRPGTGALNGAVLLCAHYDSVSAGPGAGDDALGCAVVLEIARALMAGPAPARDLILLFTDGEEIALLGARAFLGADQSGAPHPWASEVALALNFEARGSGGQAWMFQTSASNGALVGALAGAPHPAASSLAKAVYDRMPNDTDLTIFLAAGIPGLNWACIDRFASYHTALDTPERLDPGTLQQMGDQGLTVASWALQHDGPFLAADAAYFNFFGGQFVHYPLSWSAWLAIVPAAALLCWLRRRRTHWGSAALGLLATLAILAAAALVLLLAKSLFPDIFSLEASHASDAHLRGWGHGIAGSAALLAALGAWFAARRHPKLDLAAGTLALGAAGAVALSWLLPEGAFLLWVPVVAILAALLLPATGATRILARGAAIVVTISLIWPWIYNLVLALSLAGILAPALLAAFTVLLLAPLWIVPPAPPKS